MNYLPKNTYNREFNVKKQYEKMNIKILSDKLELEYEVELPKGWKIKYTDHSMYKNLVDENGFIRASIFDKNTYYEHRTDISFKHRYDFTVVKWFKEEDKGHYEMQEVKYKNPNYKKNRTIVNVGNGEFYVQSDDGNLTSMQYNQKRESEFIVEEEKVWIPKYKDYKEECNNVPRYIEITDNGEIIYTTKNEPVFFKEKYDKEKHYEWFDKQEAFDKALQQKAIDYLDKHFPKWKDINEYWQK